jgi:hypothetical protein
MSFEDEIEEWVEDRTLVESSDTYLKFKNNKITCRNLPFIRIVWEYILWTLGGKPRDYKYYTKNK